jgi:Domain of unknown function (DUF4157)
MQTHDAPELASAPVKRAAQTKPANNATLDVARAVTDPQTASVGSMLELQRLAGNATVSRMLAPEAEDAGPTESASPVLDVVGKGGGAPLEGGLRGEMESRLGADFSDVRVHTDSRASESAKSVQAKAYTVGSDVVFESGHWSPSSDEGKQTLAHELTHVVQQRNGPVAGTETGAGIRVSSPGDEFERAADASANAALAGPATAPSGASSGGAATAQRAPAAPAEEQLPEDDQATAQGSFVQREAAKPAEEEAIPEEDPTAQGSFVQRQTEDEMLDEDETKKRA